MCDEGWRQWKKQTRLSTQGEVGFDFRQAFPCLSTAPAQLRCSNNTVTEMATCTQDWHADAVFEV